MALRAMCKYSTLLTFTLPKLNYNVHDKELLVIFEAFKIWWHYLKGSPTPIDVVMDHKNLEYFSITKLLTHCQVCWSEFLCQFNLTICFHPGHLGTKPNTMGCLPQRGRKWLCQHKSDQSPTHVYARTAGIIPLCYIPLHSCTPCHDCNVHQEAPLWHPLISPLRSDWVQTLDFVVKQIPTLTHHKGKYQNIIKQHSTTKQITPDTQNQSQTAPAQIMTKSHNPSTKPDYPPSKVKPNPTLATPHTPIWDQTQSKPCNSL